MIPERSLSDKELDDTLDAADAQIGQDEVASGHAGRALPQCCLGAKSRRAPPAFAPVVLLGNTIIPIGVHAFS